MANATLGFDRQPPTGGKYLNFGPPVPEDLLVMRIRQGTPADLARIAVIKVGGWADTYGPLLSPAILRPFLDVQDQLEELRRELARQGSLLLVAVDGEDMVIAFALAFVEADPAPWLESLHVAADLRGHGVGTRLMRATAAELRKRGYNTMRLGVVSGNDGAARFYERLGGSFEGKEAASWANGVTHLLYRWNDLRPLAEKFISTASS